VNRSGGEALLLLRTTVNRTRSATLLSPTPPLDDRRQHLRFPLGLPVTIHVEGHDEAVAVEIVDIALKGVRFRASDRALPVDQRVSFGFVTSDHRTCVATGRVLRVTDGGEFVLAVERANLAFDGFVGSLAAWTKAGTELGAQ